MAAPLGAAASGAPRTSYRPRFHLTPPAGWMNDPNGFCAFGGKVHLFYQHNPRRPAWGRMHWGHAVSDDFVTWSHEAIALRPDGFWEAFLGCFSGSALVEAGSLELFYTGFSFLGQYQLSAVSEDGRSFRKVRRPCIGPGALPPGSSPLAFRDPKVFAARDGTYRCLLGASLKGEGAVLLYSSEDKRRWRYEGAVLRDRATAPGIFECPDYVRLDGADLIIASPMFFPKNRREEFENLHSAVYVSGRFDDAQRVFTPDPGPEGDIYRELDGGTDFYAPQTMRTEDGRTVMVAWMQMWKRSMPAAAEGWAGSMTLPRELSFKDGRLLQRPVRELEAYRRFLGGAEERTFEGSLSVEGVSGVCLDLELAVEAAGAETVSLHLFEGGGCGFALRYEAASGTLTADRSRSPRPVRSLSRREDGCSVRRTLLDAPAALLRLRVVIDVSTVEVFAGEGEAVLSCFYYPGAGAEGVRLEASGGAARLAYLRAWELLPRDSGGPRP